MKKFRLLLLDANVVIELFRQGIWARLIEACDVHLSRTVAECEAQFYEDNDEERHYFDLQPDVCSGAVTLFDVSLAELRSFLSRFDPTYLERLDPGEAESLAYLMDSPERYLICSADSIVYRVLGNVDRRDQGVSLEEVLRQVSLGRQLRWPFTKTFREKWTAKGFQEQLAGLGHRS